MSRNPVAAGVRPDAAEIREELLGRLGLQVSANDQEVEAAHNGLVEFLELAPHEVRSWATAQTADLDRAFALLSGPEQDLVSEAPIAAMAQDAPAETVQSPPAAPAAPSAPAKAGAFSALANSPRRKQLTWAIALVLIVGVVLAVYFMGKGPAVPGIEGTPTNNASAAPAAPTAPPLDKAKVAALTKKVTANPKDVASLQGLGDLYFASADYKNAAITEQKILDVNPKDQKALLSIGAAQFNQGNQAEAKKNWLVAAKLYPNSQEVHYDLGFLYMSQTPPDTAKMTAEWKKVVAIDPNSQLAKTVSSHIKAPTATPSAK